MNYVFVSYVRDNSKEIDRLCQDLRAAGINTWLDREQIKPGQRWKEAIRSAISEGAFFLACFSKEYNKRNKSYMNEELTLAIEELRLRPGQRSWFIPVILSGDLVPSRKIGGGDTIKDIQWVNLHTNWEEGIRKILQTINPDVKNTFEIQIPEQVSDSDYANLIDSAVKLCGLGGWEFWTGFAMGDDPSWEQSNVFQAFEFRKKIIAAIWPGRLPELERTLETLSIVLHEAASTFMKHAKARAEGFEAFPFYKEQIFPTQVYESKLEQYKAWTKDCSRLIVEATKAANWFAEIVRRDVNPMFFATEGKFMITSLPEPFRYNVESYLFEYTEEEKRDLPQSFIEKWQIKKRNY